MKTVAIHRARRPASLLGAAGARSILTMGATPPGNGYVRMRDQRITGHHALRLVSSKLARHGRTAKADLAVRLPRSLGDKSLRLAVEAADIHGHRQDVPQAGELEVAR